MSRLMFSCFLLGGITPTPDYCTNSYCAAGLVNIGCNPPPPTGGPDCEGLNFSAPDITQTEIDTILHRFNTLRAYCATGIWAYVYLPAAKRMPRLQWDAELAKQAGHNARRCINAADECHNTAEYRESGQETMFLAPFYAEIVDSPGMDTQLGVLLSEIESSRLEYQWRRLDYNKYDPKSPSRAFVSSIFNDRATKVGCAVSFWADSTYMVCNFSADLIAGRPLYRAGYTGKGCRSGLDTTYPGLCSIEEKV